MKITKIRKIILELEEYEIQELSDLLEHARVRIDAIHPDVALIDMGRLRNALTKFFDALS